jgi:hemin uptake protein HemP
MKTSKQNIYQKVNTIFNPFIRYSLFAVFALFLMSCEDVITLDVPKTDPYLVVDGSITNVAGEQVIKLTKSQDLLDPATPEGVKNATVKVTDNLGKIYEFKDLKNDGKYVWTPAKATDIMGVIGRTYSLEIKSENEIYQAVSKLNRVPKIDSIVYKLDDANVRQKGDGKPDKGYDAHFYAFDVKGKGDCYQIKVYQNGKLRNGADNIIIAYDAIANKGAFGDSLQFTGPIRRMASTELFKENDKVKVEILSITEGHFDFWTQLRQELNNAGLFARPAARIPSNIVNTNSNSTKLGAGWFGASAISSMEITIDKNKAVKDFNE